MSTSNYQLPIWYHRLAPHLKSGGVVLPWTFDEDISDLDETSQDETSAYDGPGAVYFHQLKEKREERKQELQKRKDFVQKQKEVNREEEEEKVKEVQLAYGALECSMSMGNVTELGSLDTTFELYSLDYFDHLYDPSPAGCRKKYLRLENVDGDERRNNNILKGVLWLNPDVGSETTPFYPPIRPSLKHYRLDTVDGRFSLILQFIDRNYLTLRLSRDLVFMNSLQDATGLETFLFGGIRNDWGKKLQEYAKSLSGSGFEFSCNPTT
ncbi:hypothetical protein ACLX1H_000928 [Fusarium chlamydosporum]